MSSSAAVLVSSPEQVSSERDRRLPLWLAGMLLAGVWLVCWRHLSLEWSYNEQYNYGWFVPVFALYLFWLRWEDKPPLSAAGKTPKHRAKIAAAIAIPALLVLFPIRLIEVANPDWRPISWAHAIVPVVLTLSGLYYVGGRPWLRHFAFPVLFALVAVPWISAIEDPIIQGLMPTVAKIATEALSLFGIPADLQGNLVRIGSGVVGVNEACSGVRSLQTSIMIGLLFGELKRLSVARRIFLVVAAVGIAFLANCGRAFFLVWIAATRGINQVEHFHDKAGYAIVALVFFGCLGLAMWISRRHGIDRAEIKGEQSVVRLSRFSPFDALKWLLIAGVAWLVVLEFGVELWYRAHEQHLRPTAQWNVRWPQSAPDFRDIHIDERTKRILHYDEGRGATWRNGAETSSISLGNNSSDAMNLLYFFRWRPGRNSALLANAHRPDVCLPSIGWQQTGDFGVRAYQVSPSLAIPFRHFVFGYEYGGRTHYAHAFYCVWEDRVPDDGKAKEESSMSGTPSSWSRSERISAVRNGRRHLGQQVMEYLLVAPREITPEEAENVFANTVHELIVPASDATAKNPSA